MESEILRILEKDKDLECKYDFIQDTEEKCLVNLCSNTAKAKEISSLIKQFILWLIFDDHKFYFDVKKYKFYDEAEDYNASLDEVFEYWKQNIKP